MLATACMCQTHFGQFHSVHFDNFDCFQFEEWGLIPGPFSVPEALLRAFNHSLHVVAGTGLDAFKTPLLPAKGESSLIGLTLPDWKSRPFLKTETRFLNSVYLFGE